MPHIVRSFQLRGSLLQNRATFDTNDSVEVSIHELLAFIAAGGTHHRKDCWNSRPLCH